MEYMMPFLVSLWTSAVLGVMYLILHTLGLILFTLFGQNSFAVKLCVQPGHIIVFYQILAVIAKCTIEVDVHVELDAVSPLLVPLCGPCAAVAFGVCSALIGAIVFARVII